MDSEVAEPGVGAALLQVGKPFADGVEGDDDGDPNYLANVVHAGSEQDTGPGQTLGDVHIYSLPERTTIAQNETKQVGFLDAAGVTAHKVYQFNLESFTSADNPAGAAVVVDFTNSTAGGLGAGLPAGAIRVYERDLNGDPKFVGENQIAHTPQGSELAVKIGDAFEVTVKPTLVSAEKVSRTRTRYTMTYDVHNARSDAVTVELRQGGLWGRDTKVVSETLPSRKVDAFTLGWSVPVAANAEATLKAVVETGW